MRRNTFRKWLRSQANTVEIDQHLLAHFTRSSYQPPADSGKRNS